MAPMVSAAVLIGLYGLAIATGGWDNWFAAAVLAAASFLGLALGAATPSGRDALARAAPPWIVTLGFGVAFAVGLAQLIPGLGSAHALWSLAGGEGATDPATLDPHATRIELVKLAGLAAAYVLGLAAAQDDRAPARLILVFLFTASSVLAVQGGLAAFESFERGRLAYGLGSANVAASVFGLAALAAAAWALREAKTARGARFSYLAGRAGLAWVLVAAMTAGVVMTASRAGWAALIAGALGFAAIELMASEREDRRTAATVSAGLFALLTGVALGLGGALWSRFAAFFGQGDVDRFDMIAAHRPVVEAALWRGHGLGTYEPINAVFADAAASDAVLTAGALHNAYVQMLEEAGAIGAGALLIAVAAAAWTIVRGRFVRRSHRSWLSFGVAAIVLVATHAAVEYTVNVYAVASLCALGLGALTAMAQGRR